MDVRELLTVKLCWVCRSSCLVLLCVLPTVSPPCRGRPAWIRHWFLPMLYSCFWTNHRAVQAKTAIVVSAQTPEQPIGEKRHLKVDMDLKTHAYKHINKYTVIWNIIIQIKYSLIHWQSGETNLFLYQIEEAIMPEDVLSIRSEMNQPNEDGGNIMIWVDFYTYAFYPRIYLQLKAEDYVEIMSLLLVRTVSLTLRLRFLLSIYYIVSTNSY